MIQCLFVGCSSTLSKPSDSEVKEMVAAHPDFRLVTVESIEIKEWGNFNKEEKYWPVKIRVVAIIQLPVKMDRIINTRCKKDDYGKWKMEIINME